MGMDQQVWYYPYTDTPKDPKGIFREQSTTLKRYTNNRGRVTNAPGKPARRLKTMDQFTHQHLLIWIATRFIAEDRADVHNLIYDFLKEYPELPNEGRSWPEIHKLAERNALSRSN